MSYQVLARKCRPQTFAEVIGQEHVTRTLSNAISRGRIAHAYLFAGERGVGKTSIARILAKALNCRSADGPVPEPCGTCDSCKEITQGTSMDVHEIDGASNNGVENVRELSENARYMPVRDRYKIYIIDEVHMLSKGAFNALLKTLEEPPEHVLFMFATTEPRNLPDTILSRCIRFDFRRIAAQAIIDHLESIAAGEDVEISRSALALIARESGGSMRDAQTLLERSIAYCGTPVQDQDLREMLGHIDRGLLYGVLEPLLAGDAPACIAALSGGCENGVEPEQYYFSLLEMLRDMLLLQKAGSPEKLLDLAEDDLDRLKALAGQISAEELLRCFRIFFNAEMDITRSSCPRIALELCLLEMITFKQALPLADVLGRVEALAANRPRATGPEPSMRTVQAPATGASNAQPRQSETPAPPSAPEPVASGLDGGAPDFVEFVRGKKYFQAIAHLQQGELKLDGDRLRIMVQQKSFHAGWLRDSSAQARLGELATEFYGRPVKIEVEETLKKKSPDEGRATQRREAERSALHNPIVQRVVETFQGKVVEVKTDRESA
jgi:DNA polymerase-3 subunit gamma/tau